MWKGQESKPGVMTNVCNPTAEGAEAARSQDRLGLRSETASQTNKQKQEEMRAGGRNSTGL